MAVAFPKKSPGDIKAGQTVSVTVLAEGPIGAAGSPPLTAQVRIPVERLRRGPTGNRYAVHIRKWRGTTVSPVTLTSKGDPWKLLSQPPPSDLRELLDDTRFLAQHVYGVAMHTLDIFETTLGRRMPWNPEGRLILKARDLVTATDTGYERGSNTIRFGSVDRMGYKVPTALYRDIVAHEVTHAILDGFRPAWADQLATLEQLAMHEALADLVAILSVFSSRDIVYRQLEAAAGGFEAGQAVDDALLLRSLFDFARDLFARGPLREPFVGAVPEDWQQFPEPHARGAVVVGAVLRAVQKLWSERNNRFGEAQSLHQKAESGSIVATRVLRMVIRGLSYMPPVDVGWRDLLRGIIAADLDMVPEDPHGYREALQAEFSAIGIRRVSLNNISGVENYQGLRYPVRLSALGSDPQEVQRFVWENPRLLDAARLERRTPLSSTRVRTSERVSPDGFIVSEIGASFIQTVRMSRREAFVRLGLKTRREYVDIRGGGLLRFDAGGRLVYAALKPVMDRERQGLLFGSDEEHDIEEAASSGVKAKFHSTGE
ncbi:gluzincin family metallopeptidase [Paenarthrobacter ureafaciens]